MNAEMDRLSMLIIALLRKAAGKALTKTQLIKLVFFCDLEAARQNKPLITECRYRTDQHGVVDYRIWDQAVKLSTVDEGLIVNEGTNPFGAPQTSVRMANDTFPETPDEIKQIVDKVWLKFGNWTASQLGAETHKLVPMDDEWENGVPVDPRDIAYEESDEFQKGCEDALRNYPENHTEAIPVEKYLEELGVD
ncbi:MAG: type II toxin-antitoxin system antitoxin SocA domain-containing protein [bacterium]